MSEGKNPVHVRGGENVTVTHFTIEGPNESVLVFLDACSWKAMVERAARTRARTMWSHQTDEVRTWWLVMMDRDLRAALALPPEWEPEG